MNFQDQSNNVNTDELRCSCTPEQAWAHVEALADAALAGNRKSHRTLAWHVDHALRVGQLRV